MMRKVPGLYEDVAVYDILHAPGTEQEVTGLRRIARRLGAPGAERGTWLEPACGTGRYLAAATARGIRVAGFDASEAMVAYARGRIGAMRRRGTGAARIFAADMTDFASGMGRMRVDFAFNMINTIRHLESDAAVLDHFAEMSQVMKPGAVYAVGLSTTIYGMEPPSEDVWEAKRRATHVKQVVQYVPPARGRFEKVYSHLVITRGRGGRATVEHRDSRYRLRCYTRRQWEGLIGRSALEVVAVVDENGEPIEAPEMGYGVWVLRK